MVEKASNVEEEFEFDWAPGKSLSQDDLRLSDEPEMELSEEQKRVREDAKKESEERERKIAEAIKAREEAIKSDPNFVPYKSVGEALKARDLTNFMKMLSMRGVSVDGEHKKNAAEMDMLDKLLWHVASLGFEEFVEPLKNFGADLNRYNDEGIPPFVEACAKGFVACAKELHKHGANVSLRTLGGTTAMLVASSQEQVETVRFLHEELGVSLDEYDLRGFTPLCFGCSKGNREMVEYLLFAGANPDHEVLFDDGATPDCYAEDDDLAALVIEKSKELALAKSALKP